MAPDEVRSRSPHYVPDEEGRRSYADATRAAPSPTGGAASAPARGTAAPVAAPAAQGGGGPAPWAQPLHDLVGRVHMVEAQSARNEGDIRKLQEIEASKQAVVQGWPKKMNSNSRRKAIRSLIDKWGMWNDYIDTVTLGPADRPMFFSIVEFSGKGARDYFLQRLWNEKFWIEDMEVIGKKQIPKYQREKDMPLRVLIKAVANVCMIRERMPPTWDLLSVWWKDHWLLSVGLPLGDGRIPAAVSASGDQLREIKNEAEELWATWAGYDQRERDAFGRTKRGFYMQDYFRLDISEMGPDLTMKLDDAYTELTQRKPGKGKGKGGGEDTVMGDDFKGGGAKGKGKDKNKGKSEDWGRSYSERAYDDEEAMLQTEARYAEGYHFRGGGSSGSGSGGRGGAFGGRGGPGGKRGRR